MITLSKNALEELQKSGAKVTARITTAPDPKPAELVDILREMKRFNGQVAQALSEPDAPEVPDLPPIVSVAAPVVTLAPNIQVERPSKWRFTVTKRDQNAQYRIQEIIAEIIE
jgi:hypothetical protein